MKQRRNFKSNRRTLYRRCFDVWMLTLNQRSQNDVRMTLISRCRRCQPIFNQISTSKRRRMPAGFKIDRSRSPYHKTSQYYRVNAYLFCYIDLCFKFIFLRSPTRKALQRAKENVDKYLVVGILEEYDDFIKVLEKLLPNFFQGAYKYSKTPGNVCFKRQFFSMSRIFDKKRSKPKIFLAFVSNSLCFCFVPYSAD